MALQKIIESFTDTKILVVGDVMLDKYIFGKVSRISPEAPVQIVNVEKEEYRLGGAANVAKNIKSLGGQPTLCGVIGKDSYGSIFIEELEKAGIAPKLVKDSSFMTTCKVRLMAQHQQLIRFDYEEAKNFPKELENNIIQDLEKEVKENSAIVLPDYKKGMFLGKIGKSIIGLAKKYDKPIIADPKPVNAKKFVGTTLLCPNLSEAKQIIKKEKNLGELGRKLIKKLGLEFVVITCGEDGLFVAEKSGKSQKFKSEAKEVYDVTGAGDTVSAVLALGLGNKIAIYDTAFLANKAGGVVVGKVGTASLTQKELIESL